MHRDLVKATRRDVARRPRGQAGPRRDTEPVRIPSGPNPTFSGSKKMRSLRRGPRWGRTVDDEIGMAGSRRLRGTRRSRTGVRQTDRKRHEGWRSTKVGVKTAGRAGRVPYRSVFIQLLHRCRNVAPAVQHARHIDVIAALDMEHLRGSLASGQTAAPEDSARGHGVTSRGTDGDHMRICKASTKPKAACSACLSN